jgi:hypothetical protein
VVSEILKIPNSGSYHSGREIQEETRPIPHHFKGIENVIEDGQRDERFVYVEKVLHKMYGYLKYIVSFFRGLPEYISTYPYRLNSIVYVGLYIRFVGTTIGSLLALSASTLKFYSFKSFI